MTYARREEIFAKEAFTNQDLAEIFNISESMASIKAKEIKRKVGDRLGIQGRLHIQDYLDFIGVKEERYNRDIGKENKHERTIDNRHSGGGIRPHVCDYGTD
jgi:hypothetical protein